MLLATTISGCTKANNSNTTPVPGQEISVTTRPATVYFTREITPASLIKIYQALGREATGKVGIKLSMGEPGGHNYLKPELVGDLVRMVNGTFIDANTAYGGNRATTELHLKTAEDHGFTAIATIDILDSEGEIHLPIIGGKHLKYDIVGSNFPNYDFTVVLSHFKGHMMGGFGGALKIYPSVSHHPPEKPIFVPQVKALPVGVILNKMISLSPWPKPLKLLLSIVEIIFCI